MKANRIFLLLATVFCLSSLSAQPPVADYQVVPLPENVSPVKAKPFVLNAETRVCYPADSREMARNASFLADYIREQTGLSVLPSPAETGSNVVRLQLDERVKEAEGYVIEVSSKAVTISGRTPQGVFYGLQTLRKSLPVVADAAEISLPAVTITDAPRFAHRGMMLDSGRHFFTVGFVKRFIDLLAIHGMNVFHWHLSDDQGWRIEIKKYPLLTEIGSQRAETVVGRNTHVYDGTPYGGFYTQDEIREVVAYAAERYVTVVPEIDMPGHMLSALTAYPDLGCTGGPYAVSRRWGIFDDVLCLGNERVYEFCQDVLGEVIDLFPSRLIHIGGDEAPNERWASCPKCQKLMAGNGLTPQTIQGYFTNRIERFVNSRGRNIIGWDEILDGHINQSATIQSWRGAETGVRAAREGHDVIMSPTSHCYFDYLQSDNPKAEPTLCGGFISVEKVYSLDPTAGLSDRESAHILGVQANLWTEYIASPQQAEYQLLPRIAALSEVQWMKSGRDYEGFLARLPRLVDLYDLYRYNYATHLWPERQVAVEGFRPSGD
ncbi:MAG: beta-N-acetylhexosaminidase [Prevotella sp.]|nr:beta-N-acetylhexosaminidase [Prevotella sp.]